MWEIRSPACLELKGWSKCFMCGLFKLIAAVSVTAYLVQIIILSTLSTACLCSLCSEDSLSYSPCWLRDFYSSKMGHLLKLPSFFFFNKNGQTLWCLKDFYVWLRADRLNFLASQEDILKASPPNGIYNDPWGVHSCQVCSDMSKCHGFKPNHNCPPL